MCLSFSFNHPFSSSSYAYSLDLLSTSHSFSSLHFFFRCAYSYFYRCVDTFAHMTSLVNDVNFATVFLFVFFFVFCSVLLFRQSHSHIRLWTFVLLTLCRQDWSTNNENVLLDIIISFFLHFFFAFVFRVRIQFRMEWYERKCEQRIFFFFFSFSCWLSRPWVSCMSKQPKNRND